MIKIDITQKEKNVEDLVDTLHLIANMLESGVTRSYGPDYVVTGIEEDNEEAQGE